MKIVDHVSFAAAVAALVLALFATLVRLNAENVLDADYVDGENSAELVTPEAVAALGALVGQQNARSLAHAMRLNMALYDGDMRSQAGRRHWHGQMIAEIVNTNGLYKIEVYSNTVNGAVWRFKTPFRPKALNAPKRTVTMSTNGVPARLAAARTARLAQINGGVVTTNIVRTANK